MGIVATTASIRGNDEKTNISRNGIPTSQAITTAKTTKQPSTCTATRVSIIAGENILCMLPKDILLFSDSRMSTVSVRFVKMMGGSRKCGYRPFSRISGTIFHWHREIHVLRCRHRIRTVTFVPIFCDKTSPTMIATHCKPDVINFYFESSSAGRKGLNIVR